MSEAYEEDFDRFTMGRAIQYEFRLVRRESGRGERLFEWRGLNGDAGPQFSSRRRALDWMSEFLDGGTPPRGISLPPLAAPER